MEGIKNKSLATTENPFPQLPSSITALTLQSRSYRQSTRAPRERLALNDSAPPQDFPRTPYSRQPGQTPVTTPGTDNHHHLPPAPTERAERGQQRGQGREAARRQAGPRGLRPPARGDSVRAPALPAPPLSSHRGRAEPGREKPERCRSQLRPATASRSPGPDAARPAGAARRARPRCPALAGAREHGAGPGPPPTAVPARRPPPHLRPAHPGRRQGRAPHNPPPPLPRRTPGRNALRRRRRVSPATGRGGRQRPAGAARLRPAGQPGPGRPAAGQGLLCPALPVPPSPRSLPGSPSKAGQPATCGPGMRKGWCRCHPAAAAPPAPAALPRLRATGPSRDGSGGTLQAAAAPAARQQRPQK